MILHSVLYNFHFNVNESLSDSTPIKCFDLATSKQTFIQFNSFLHEKKIEIWGPFPTRWVAPLVV